MCDSPLAREPWARAPDRHHGTPGEFQVLQCPRCGLKATFPPETADELAGRYPGGYEAYGLPSRGAAAIASRVIRTRQDRSRFRSEPLRHTAALDPARAVDVGCGRGDLGASLIARGWAVTGVEPSPAACGVAAARGLDARTGLLQEVALEPASYRLATFQHSLEHVNDPVADLGLIAEALEPGGLCAVTVPNAGGWQARRFRSRWYHLDVPRHRVHFSRASLRTALERAGLEPVALTTSSSAVGFAASIQYALVGRCLFPSGLALRIATVAAVALYPLVLLIDRLGGEGDLLHALARRPG